MKTLYVSDLDGTLLTSEAQVSDESVNILNSLIDEGVLFTVATARSVASVRPIMQKVRLNLPVILMNGVFVHDLEKGQTLFSAGIHKNDAEKIIEITEKYNECPFLFCKNQGELLVYFTDLPLKEQRDYYNERSNLTDKRFCEVRALKVHENDIPVYFSFLDTKERLSPLYEEITEIDGVSCVFYKDSYTEKLWFLEVFSKEASKPYGVEFIKEMTGAERVVVFGDNLNDIPMFKSADECYAVENARDEVRAIANGIIGHHNKNGVAKFIQKDLNK